MKKYSAVYGFLFALPVVFSALASSGGFKLEVLPSEINPGDAFVVKITGVNTSRLPAAFLNDNALYFGTCGKGCFIAVGAVEIETKPGLHTIKVIVDDEEKKANLSVKRASFPEISLMLPEEKVFLSPENLKRVDMEEEKLKSIWPMVSDKLWDGSFSTPLENSVSTAFGTKRIINEKKISVHRGLDITGQEGEDVKAANRGRVVLTEELFFGGNTVIIDHGYGIYTIYMHLSKFNVKVDNIVSKGEVIGFVGSSGRTSGPHLHFGVKISNISANPISLLQLKL